MWSRRQFLSRSSGALLGLAGSACRLPGGDRDNLPDGGASKDMITPAAQRVINEGLAFLARQQQPDGSFGSFQHPGNVAITSLAGLAMMAGGHQPGRGVYGDVVTKALRYVIDTDDGTGYLISKRGQSHGPMYGHGFGTLFLAEVHGMVHDKSLRENLRATLKRAIKLLVQSQVRQEKHDGGWRYTPHSQDADISVTVCQIMALRAARNAGFSVPKSTVDRCTKYVKDCQQPDGGFRYQQLPYGPQGYSGFARSAAGVVALHCAGLYKDDAVTRGLSYLTRYRPLRGGGMAQDVNLHYFYGHYYAAQAMWTAGGNYWAEWYPAIRDELITHPERQPHLGCWTDHRFSNDYATAMACIILQIPNNYLPILQK